MKLPLWATFFTLIGITILCALGTWQLQRLAWKNDIIAKLETAYGQAEQAKPLNLKTINPDDFAYGKIKGTFLADKALLMGLIPHPKNPDKGVGKNLIVPLKTKDGTLLVNLGWTKWNLEETGIYLYQGKTITFVGLARKPSWNGFTPDNNPEKEQWFKPDITEIAQVKSLKNPLPHILYADRASEKFDAQLPLNKRWQPKNDHLQYALFWFTLALALAIIYTLRFLKKQP